MNVTNANKAFEKLRFLQKRVSNHLQLEPQFLATNLQQC